MNKIEQLQKRATELEATLELQVTRFKKDSKVWVQMGGTALIAGLVAYSVVKRKKGKKKKKKKRVKTEEEGTSHSKASFFPSFRKRLMLALLAYGQSRVFDMLKKPNPHHEK